MGSTTKDTNPIDDAIRELDPELAEKLSLLAKVAEADELGEEESLELLSKVEGLKVPELTDMDIQAIRESGNEDFIRQMDSVFKSVEAELEELDGTGLLPAGLEEAVEGISQAIAAAKVGDALDEKKTEANRRATEGKERRLLNEAARKKKARKAARKQKQKNRRRVRR